MRHPETYCTSIYNDLTRLIDSGSEADFRNHSLFEGIWGVLLFTFYYEQYYNPAKERAIPLLQRLYDELPTEEQTDFTYCNGLTGPYWLLHHLHRHDFVSLDTNNIFPDYIPLSIAASNKALRIHNFDFLHGSAGICNFLASFPERTDVREHLGHFVQSLHYFSEPTTKGRSIPMFYTPERPSLKGTDAFSLAHGTCSLQILLCKIHEAGIEQPLCEQLVYETMDFVLQHEGEIHFGAWTSRFPDHAPAQGQTTVLPSRVSWCYGDLCVANALWHCGRHFSEQRWTDKAMDILHFNTRRNTLDSGGITEACLCHGAAGNAAFYRRFWHETNDKRFLQCSEDWYRLTAGMVQFPETKAEYGIRSWRGEKEGWRHSWNMLNGSAGVGLSLLMASAGKALPWDESMLLS